MNVIKLMISILFFSMITVSSKAQTPTAPNGKKWEKIDELSDEFNGTSLNTAKWAINSPQWEGRRPARFEESSVSVSGGNLKISASKKSNPSNGWTHNGGLVRSKTKNLYGYYEARMKANKTFMSSTFWLINKRNEGSGCDIRTTELDITETVGVNSGNANWINTMIKSMNSNTHSRNTNCSSTPVGQKGGKAELGGQSWQGYHTYGVWWKNKNEVLFYLDGKLVNTITPPADFDLPMYLRMVVETYDWNPPKAGQDGMNDSAANRTTYYDWVRSYKLVDDTGNEGVDKVGFINAPTTMDPQTSYTFTIDYEASDNREIVVEFWSATSWIAQQKEIVVKGKGTKAITVTLPSLPTAGSGYMYKTHIRPMGTTWREAIDRDQIDNVVVENVDGAQDWQGIPVPANAGNGKKWELLPNYSDDFNYNGKGNQFNSKWKDTYFNGWSGPGLTEWTRNNSNVSGGNLIIKASRKQGTNKVHCGVITSKTPIKYPIYTEVRAKVANQVLSSNFWFLSPDDKREIDILEIYGGDRPNQTWFAARASSNYHVFIRGANNQILQDLNDQQHHTLPNQEPWRNDWHTFGAYWKDAFTVDFYYDGKLVHKLRRDGINDPEGLGLNRDSFMIIDIEDHAWRSNQGIVATDAELANQNKNKYYVDWVRTYKPVSDGTPPSIVDEVSFKNAPTTINPERSYTFNMEYAASVDREIAVSFWKNNTWIASKVERVNEGSGIKAVTVNLPSLPIAGNGYAYKSHIRPVGTNWQQALDADEVINVTVVVETNPPSSGQLITNGTYFITSNQNDQRLLSRGLENHSARMHDSGNYDDQRWVFTHLGDDVYTIKNKGTSRFLEVPYAKCGNGNNVATYTSANSNHQKWKAIKNGDVYSFKPMHCQNVALDRAAAAINANVHTWGYSATNNNQKWKLMPSSGARSIASEIFKENKIDLYPNPATDVIRIQGVKHNTQVKVIDFYGNEVINSSLNGNALKVDKLPSGIYFLHTGKGAKTKFVIE